MTEPPRGDPCGPDGSGGNAADVAARAARLPLGLLVFLAPLLVVLPDPSCLVVASVRAVLLPVVFRHVDRRVKMLFVAYNLAAFAVRSPARAESVPFRRRNSPDCIRPDGCGLVHVGKIFLGATREIEAKWEG